MNYEDAVSLLTSAGKFYVDLGLDRVDAVLKLFDNPQDKLKCIQVAGTNGKGSVCAMISEILNEAGYKVGLYTSPHIFDYTERIKISGIDISKDDFAFYLEDIVTVSGVNNIHLTEFEILTVVMFRYFADKKVDYAVIETGLGGRLDATNVLKTNIASVITHIDLDHTERLGKTKSDIAFEKAGIIKENSVVFTSEGYEVIKDKADEMNSMFVLVPPVVSNEYVNALSLSGECQRENLALVLALFDDVFKGVKKETVLKGLSKVKHICRFQYLSDKNMIIDGAHNPNCFKSLRESLDKYYPDTKKRYIFGCLRNKDYKNMISYIESDTTLEELYFYTFNNKNSCTYSELSDVCKYSPKELKSISELVFDKNILTVVCGSFYMLNELLSKEEIFV